MAKMDFEFVIRGAEYRQCIVNAKRALFHRWMDRAYVAGNLIDRDDSTVGQNWEVLGIVEYEDGTVGKAFPHEIRFKDGKFREYFGGETDGET